MAISTSTEKFSYELGDIYNAEHQIVGALQKMIPQASDDTLKDLLQQHLHQTNRQIQRLNQVWSLLGQQPQQVTCDGVNGILSEGKKAIQQATTDMLRDGLIASGADKVEHYEIASYSNLIVGARLMGQNQIVSLLQQNLDEECWMAQQLEQCEPDLAETLLSAEGILGAGGVSAQNIINP